MLILNGYDLILNRTSFTGNRPNSAFIFMNESNSPVKLHTFIYIANSDFTYGISGSSFYGGGLSLSFLQASHTVYVSIVEVALYNNIGISYGNFFMMIGEWSCKYTMVQVDKIRSSNGLRRNLQGFFVKVLPPPSSHDGAAEYSSSYSLFVCHMMLATSILNLLKLGNISKPLCGSLTLAPQCPAFTYCDSTHRKDGRAEMMKIRIHACYKDFFSLNLSRVPVI